MCLVVVQTTTRFENPMVVIVTQMSNEHAQITPYLVATVMTLAPQLGSYP